VQVKSLRIWKTHIVSGKELAARKVATQLIHSGGDAEPFCTKKVKRKDGQVLVEIDAAATSEKLQQAVVAEVKTTLDVAAATQLVHTIDAIK
jgi:hypothetical protein